MKKAIIFISFIICILLQAKAQETGFASKIQKMDSLTLYAYNEKVYIQTDLPIYFAGDTLWYKVWVLQAGTLLPTEKSKRVYVDLVNNRNQIIQTAQYTLNQGMANGQLILPKLQNETQSFRLRAYTRWQKNFEDSVCFEKIIPVWNDKAEREREQKQFVGITDHSGRKRFFTQQQYQKRLQKQKEKQEQFKQQKENIEFKLDIQFLPEGGRMIENIPNRIAVKALFPDGTGANIEGTIIDQEENIITGFKAIHKGMGSFIFTPETGKTYKAKLFNGHEFELPNAEKEGINMMLLPKTNNDTIYLAINASKQIYKQKQKFILITQTRGLLTQIAIQAVMNKTREIIAIPTTDILKGIQKLTLFNEKGEPLCERLVYINKPEKDIRFNYTADWTNKSDSEQYIKIKIKPEINKQPVQTALSISITNANTVSQDNPQKTLATEMLLSSELKGNVEEPDFYFYHPYDSIKDKLDLVMLTHGWRGYNWTTDMTRTFRYTPDSLYNITGKVMNALNKPAKDRKVSLFLQGGKTIYDEAYSDENGRFTFEELDIRENSIARITIEKETKEKRKSSMGLGVTFDKQGQIPSFPVKPVKEKIYEDTYLTDLIDLYNDNIEREKIEMDSLRKKHGKYLLDEVVYTEKKRRLPGSWSKGQEADMIVDSTEIEQFEKFTSALDILKAKIPELTKNSKSIKYGGGMIPLQNEHYKINNALVYFQVDAELLMFGNQTFKQYDSHDYAEQIRRYHLVASLPDDFFILRYDSDINVNYINELLSTLPANEIRSIEVLTSRQNLLPYVSIGFAPVANGIGTAPQGYMIVITTKSGKGAKYLQGHGIYMQTIQGSSVAKEFYVPKYYPAEPYDREAFDRRPLLYWNPNIVTDEKGETEIKFPVGIRMKDNLQMEIEAIDGRGHIGSERKIIFLNE